MKFLKIYTEILKSTVKHKLNNEKKNRDKFINNIFKKAIDNVYDSLRNYLKFKYISYFILKFWRNNNRIKIRKKYLRKKKIMKLFINCFYFGKLMVYEQKGIIDMVNWFWVYKNKSNEYILIKVKISKERYDKYLYKKYLNDIKQIEIEKYDPVHKRDEYTSFIIYGIVFHRKYCGVEI